MSVSLKCSQKSFLLSVFDNRTTKMLDCSILARKMTMRPYIRLIGVIVVVFLVLSVLLLDTRSKGESMLKYVSSERGVAVKDSKIVAQIEHPAELYRAGFVLEDISKKLLDQRNNLSRILNLKQQRIGQLECEVSAGLFYVRVLKHYFPCMGSC